MALGWWLMNLFKDCSVESFTSNIDQSVLIRAFSQSLKSLLFLERRHYIPEKSNLRWDLTIQKPYEDITLEILEGKTLMDWFLFCEEEGKELKVNVLGC